MYREPCNDKRHTANAYHDSLAEQLKLCNSLQNAKYTKWIQWIYSSKENENESMCTIGIW